MARNGNELLNGTLGNDHLTGGARDDILNGMAGHDRLDGGAGNDTLDGGSGNDIVNGDSGNDLLIYRTAENVGDHDVYDGGSGIDTLRLVLTGGVYGSAAFQADLARFEAFLAANVNRTNHEANNRTFTFTAFDLTVSKIEGLDIVVENKAPTATPVTLAAIAEDNIGRLITQAELLGTAFDPDGDVLNAVDLTIATGNGSLIDNGNGTWTYIPAANDDTQVTFNYRVTDGLDSATGTASLDITPVNDAPAAGNDSASTKEDTAVTLTSVLANDTDVDGDTLTVTAVNDGANGVAVLNLDGSITYTPKANFHGTDTFSYTVSDGHGGSATGNVTVVVTPVNDSPVRANPIPNRTIQEDQFFSFSFAANTFLDVDGDTLIYTATRGDGGLLPSWLHFNAATRTFSGTPPQDLNGVRNIRVTASDGTAAPVAVDVFQLTIAPVNDAPVRTTGAVFLPTIQEDATNPAGTTVATLLGSAFTDFADQVVGGSSANAFAGIAISGNESVFSGVWQWSTNGVAWNNISTSLSLANALTLAPTTLLRFIPATDYNGSSPPIHVHLVDNSAGAVINGGTVDLTATGIGGSTQYSAETVAVYNPIDAVNDAPIARPPWGLFLAPVEEDSVNPTGSAISTLITVPEVFDIADFVPGSSVPDAFAGIAIIGNETFASLGQWQWSTNGTSWNTIPADGGAGSLSNAHALILAAGTLLRFVPSSNYNTSSPALQVRVIEDSAGSVANGSFVNLDLVGTGGATQYSADVVQIYVPITPVNDAPIATLDSVTLQPIDEDALDPAGQTVGAVVGAAFSDPIDIVAGGSQANALAGIAIVANAATAAQGAWQWFDGAAWQTIGSGLTASTALVLAADTLIRFVPAADFNGAAPILSVHLIDDSSGAVTSGSIVDVTMPGGITPYSAGAVTIHAFVDAINDAPEVLLTSAPIVVDEDTPIAISGISVSDRDAGSVSITTRLSVVSGTLAVSSVIGGAAVSGNGTGTVTLIGSLSQINTTLGAVGAILYQGLQDFNGDDQLTVTVDDGGANGQGGALTDTDTLAIVVNAIADAPVANADSYAVDEDGQLVVAASTGVLFNDYDGDGDTLTAQLVDGPSHGLLTFNPDGSFTYTPNGDFNGSDTFRYFVNDGSSDSNIATVTLAVNAVNDAPDIDAPASVALGTSTVFTTFYFNDFEHGNADVSAPQIINANAVRIVEDSQHGDHDLVIEGSKDHLVTDQNNTDIADMLNAQASEFFDLTGGSTTGGVVTMSFTAPAGSKLSFDWTYSGGGNAADYSFYAIDGQVYGLKFTSQVGGYSASSPWDTTTVTLTTSGTHLIGFGAIRAGSSELLGNLRIDNVKVTQSAAVETVTINDIVISDVDAGGDFLRVDLAVGHGKLVLSDISGLDLIDANGSDGTLTFEGTLAELNAAFADGLVYITPSGSGSDTLTVTVSDLGHNGAGGSLNDIHQILLQV